MIQITASRDTQKGTIFAFLHDVLISIDKAKPVAKQGRKALGSQGETAGLPISFEGKLMKKTQLLLISCLLIACACVNVSASPLGHVATLETWMNEYVGAGNYETVTHLNLNGDFYFTALAYEAGDTNTITSVGKANDGSSFSTSDTGNFGEWHDVRFGRKEDPLNSNKDIFPKNNLLFEDRTPPAKWSLFDEYHAGTADDYNFRVYLITCAVSSALDYLPVNSGMRLEMGTFIIGWDDEVWGREDGDFDDIIAAVTGSKPSPVPEPTTMMLFGIGLLGLAGAGRKKQ